MKGNASDKFLTVTLFLVRSSVITMFTIDTATLKILDGLNKEEFGDRITAEINNGDTKLATYVVTLQNLDYNDTNLFRLAVETGSGELESGTKRVNIKLLVQGKESIIICYPYLLSSFCEKVRKTMKQILKIVFKSRLINLLCLYSREK